MAEIEVKLPRFDPGMEEGVIIKWLKVEGDSVEEDEQIASIEGEKTTSEVNAPRSGVIKSIICEEGDIADVGETIAIIESED